MRRILAIAMCLMIIFSVCSYWVSAENTDVENTAINTTVGGYNAYLKRYSSAKTPNLQAPLSFEAGEYASGSVITAPVTVNEDGLYNIRIDYTACDNGNTKPDIGIKIDGEVPFPSAAKMLLPRLYRDSGEKRKDGIGNEFAPVQEQVFDRQSFLLSDYSSFSTDACRFYLDAGTHTVDITVGSLSVIIHTVTVCGVEAVSDYKTVSNGYDGYNPYDGREILVEGESAAFKSDIDLAAKSDMGDVSVYPSDPFLQKVNFIGGSNWSDTGDTVVWEVEVPRDGLYNLSMHFRQSAILNGNSYRSILIDDEIPFVEASRVAFPYANGWQMMTLADGEENPYLFYLTEGKHTISMSVTLGPLAAFCSELETVTYDIGTLYRQLVMVTGETPDNNRDYNLFKQIPDFEGKLSDIEKRLRVLAGSYEELSGTRGGSTVSILESMANTVSSMLKHKHRAQQYKSSYYSNYSSLSAAMYDMLNMPLDIDTIVLSAPQKAVNKADDGFIKQFSYAVRRFVASFVVDYNNISGNNEEKEALTIWINWGRDQAQVLNFLIQSGFTEETGIPVNVKITSASIVNGILSGKVPDCALQMAQTEPVNLALRNALCDLRQFDGIDEVLERFADTAEVPYIYKNGLYGLPDTQNFNMLFVRTDVFEELGLEVPRTWTQFIDVIKKLSGKNLEAGVSGLYLPLLLQNGGTLYNEQLNKTAILSDESVAAFEMYTDFFTKYGCPKSFNFYNRFRTGLMPIGIQNYVMYATLKATAPEINGRWEMFEIPGFEQEDGTLNNLETGGGTACVILKDGKNHQGAWEFLKWWTTADVQYEYTSSLEAILGVSGRVAISNREAASRLEWDSNNFARLYSQWDKVREFNEVPGSYYTTRAIDQAYWNVVENEANPRDMLYEWGAVADNEIERKIAQYK